MIPPAAIDKGVINIVNSIADSVCKLWRTAEVQMECFSGTKESCSW